MYTLARKLASTRMALEQAVSLGSAWIVAELFYKFGSFTLELAAFLVTWFAIDLIIQVVSPRVVSRSGGA